MASFVLDASLALEAILPNEPAGEIATVLMARVAAEGAVAPGLWPLEIANAILMRERRRRLPAEAVSEIVEGARTLNVIFDAQTAYRAFSRTWQLAGKHHLTDYDANYLELALRVGLPLMSLDADLRRAAVAEGIAILPA